MRILLTGALGALLLASGAAAQQIQFGDRPVDRVAESKKLHVVLLTDSAEVTAGLPQELELRFRVDPGYHINSHAPKDELLLPTSLTLEPVQAIKVAGQEYPTGVPFRLAIGDGETLDVYQNEFRVRLRLVAQRGSYTLNGALRFQACDSAACYPPRTLPVKVILTVK